jgi:hypothetical protein
MRAIFVTGFPDLAGEVPGGLGPVLLKPIEPQVLISAIQVALPAQNRPGAGRSRIASQAVALEHPAASRVGLS